MNGSEAILKIIDNVRRRSSVANRVRGAAYIAMALCVSLTIMTILFGLSPMGVPPVWLAAPLKIIFFMALAAAIALFAVLFKQPERRPTALTIESALKDLRNDLIISLDLVEDKEFGRNIYSAELAQAHVLAASGRLVSMDFSPAIPSGRMKKYLIAAAFAATVALISAIIAPNGFMNGAAFLFALRLTPDKEKVEAKEERPLALGDIEVRYEYPVYTGRDPGVQTAGDGTIDAIKGTIAKLSARSVNEISSATVRLENSSIPAQVTDGHKIEVSIPVMKQGAYKIDAIGADEKKYTEPAAHHIKVQQDAYPTIDMVEPAADIEVEEAEVIELKFSSEDDFGIKQIDIVYSVSGRQDRLTIVSPEGSQKIVSGSYTWDIAALNTRPGDRVAFYLEVWDNDTISGPKKTQSRSQKIDIYDPQKEHQDLVDKQWEITRNMVHLLGDELVNEPPAALLSDEQFEKEKKIFDKISAIEKQLQSLIESMQNDRYAEAGLFMTLENVRSDFEEMAKTRKRHIDGKTKQGSIFASFKAKETPVVENDVIAMDSMLERQKTLDVMSAADDMLKAQRSLSELLAKAQKGDAQALKQAQAELARLQAAMARLNAAMARGSKDLPDEFLNADAMKNLPLDKTSDMFKAMQNAMKDGDIKSALDMARQMQDQMSQMMSQLEGGMGAYGKSAFSEQFAQLYDLADKLDKIRDLQKKVYDETQNVGVGNQEELLKRQEAKLAKSEDKLRKLLQELIDLVKVAGDDSRNLDLSDPSKDRASFYQAMNQVTTNLANMQSLSEYVLKMLDERDLFRLKQEMVSWKNRIEAVRSNAAIIDNTDKFPKDAGGQLLKRANRMTALIDEILKLLDNTLVKPDRNMSDADKKKLDELAKRQSDLEKQTRELASKLEKLQEKLPMIKKISAEKISDAAGSMKDAQGKLGEKNPDGALPSEADALKKLDETSKSLKNTGSKCSSGKCGGMGMPMPMGGGGSKPGGGDREGYQRPGTFTPGEVEIPGRAGYKVPEKFRDEILKAMKNKSPEQYRELNRDYYRKLVE